MFPPFKLSLIPLSSSSFVFKMYSGFHLCPLYLKNISVVPRLLLLLPNKWMDYRWLHIGKKNSDSQVIFFFPTLAQISCRNCKTCTIPWQFVNIYIK